MIMMTAATIMMMIRVIMRTNMSTCEESPDVSRDADLGGFWMLNAVVDGQGSLSDHCNTRIYTVNSAIISDSPLF
jgi:hypothetical protein